MLDTRRFAPRIATFYTGLVIGASAIGSALHSAAPVGAQWQSAGAPGATATPTAPSNNQWRLPNELPQTQASQNENSSTSTQSHNPLRPKQVAAAPVREPRAFQPPTNATPAPAPRNANANSSRTANTVTQTAAAQQPATTASKSKSPAVAQTSAVMPKGTSRQANARTAQNQRFTRPRTVQPSPMMRGNTMGRLPATSRPRMNVAMQAPQQGATQGTTSEAEAWDESAEDLPLPGNDNPSMQGRPNVVAPMHDPFGSDSGPHGPYFDEGYSDEYYPTCGPDGCCNEGCCEDGCCGDACGCGDTCGCGDACSCGGACGCHCEGGECCNDCLSIGPGDPESCHTVRIRVPKWQDVQVFGGVQGFKGPYDQARDSGNFGFHEGFNIGAKIPYTYAGYQIGYQSTQSQLNGDKDTDIRESHTQHFITFGMFRRCDDGLQFGTAWDVLRDERFEARDFHQLRSEVSWLDCRTHEFGISATVHLNEYEYRGNGNGNGASEFDWQATDQFLGFYRFHGKTGGEGRVYAGVNDDSDGIVGADLLMPVQDRWSVQTGFTYLIPDATNGTEGASEEAWNISLAMVWHWDCAARKTHFNKYRPLFNVANNGYLIVDHRE